MGCNMGERLENLTDNEIYGLIDLLREQKDRFVRQKLGLEPMRTLPTDLALADFICELLGNEIQDRTKKKIQKIMWHCIITYSKMVKLIRRCV